VGVAVALLERSGVSLPKSNVEWTAVDLRNGPRSSGLSIFKHGFGCSVKAPEVIVDFDFGTSGQTNGFDLGRLQAFASRRSDLYGFRTLNEVRTAYDQATNSREIRVDIDHLGYLGDVG
jgi:hypothetical protein